MDKKEEIKPMTEAEIEACKVELNKMKFLTKELNVDYNVAASLLILIKGKK